MNNSVRNLWRRLPALALLASALTLSACAQFGHSISGEAKNAKPQIVAEPDPTSLMIADAADRATRALETLAAVEQVRTPSAAAAATTMVPNAPPELQRAVTFEWAGPAEDVARDLAGRAGYGFRTVGDQPPTPILVNLSIYNEPLIEVFRNLGLQMGTRADLKLDANRRMVEIVYANTVNRPVANSSSVSTGRRR